MLLTDAIKIGAEKDPNDHRLFEPCEGSKSRTPESQPHTLNT